MVTIAQLRANPADLRAACAEGLLVEGRVEQLPTAPRAAVVITAVTDREALVAGRQADLQQLAAALGPESRVYPLCKAGDNPAERICLGRGKRNDVVLDDPTVSTLHCYLERDEERGLWRVQDAGSSNGTRLNGRRLAAGEVAIIRSGDCLRAGDRVLYYLSPRSFQDLLQQA